MPAPVSRTTYTPGTAFQRLLYPSSFIATVNFFCLRDAGGFYGEKAAPVLIVLRGLVVFARSPNNTAGPAYRHGKFRLVSPKIPCAFDEGRLY